MGVKSKHLTTATKEANGITLLRLGETETRRNGAPSTMQQTA